MPLSGFVRVPLSEQLPLSSFDCGERDLNDFIQNDAEKFRSQLLATTFLFEDPKEQKIVAYYSIFNDKISFEQIDSLKIWKSKIGKRLHHYKRGFKSMPALKIGRLAVSNSYKGNGVGGAILDFLKLYAFKENDKSGCKFLTVDAYAASIEFYLKNGFQFMTENDKNKHTRQMYYDLMKLSSV